MTYAETVASGARYGECAGVILQGADIIWEQSYADYQGECELLAQLPDGAFVMLSWSYGSCSGCDTWEAQGLDDDGVVQAMRDGLEAWSEEGLRHYLQVGATDAQIAQRVAHREVSDEFVSKRRAFIEWLKLPPPEPVLPPLAPPAGKRAIMLEEE